MALPIPPSGRAVGQLIAAINDGPDPDSEPEIIPARGEASFTATVSHVPVPGAEPNPYTLIPRPRTGVFDENGFLCTPRTNLAGEILLDEQGHPLIEAQGVKLTANEIDGTSVENWTWSVSLRLTGENGKWLQTIPAFSLPVPAGGEVDITKYMGVPATIPLGTAQAFLLVDQAEQHARAAVEASSPETVAAFVSEEGNPLRTAVQKIAGGTTYSTALAGADLNALVGPAGAKLTTPTHDGSGQAVHPSVLEFPKPWNGYRYWMALTPYPGSNDAHEDPNILVSNNGTDWSVPPGLVNPIDDAPGGADYNSDPNLVLGPEGDGKMYLFWRNSKSTTGVESLHYTHSTDGVTWAPRTQVFSSTSNARLLAPSFVWEDGGWTMWAVDTSRAPKALVRRRSLSLTGAGWGPLEDCTIPLGADRTPWHAEVRKYGDIYLGLINDNNLTEARTKNLYVMTSTDGLNWRCGAAPVVSRVSADHDYIYHASCVPVLNAGRLELDLFYSAVRSESSASNVWNIFRSRVRSIDPWTTAPRQGALRLEGGGGVYTPEAPAITGDFRVEMKVSMDDWINNSVSQTLAGQYSSRDRGWILQIRNTYIRLFWSTNGTTTNSPIPTAKIPGGSTAPGATLWVAAELDVDNGAGGWTVKYFWGTDGVTWSQLGTDLTGSGVTSIKNTGLPLEIGAYGLGGNDPVLGADFHRLRIYNSLPATTPVVDADFGGQLAAQDALPLRITDRTGKRWTWGGKWRWTKKQPAVFTPA